MANTNISKTEPNEFFIGDRVEFDIEEFHNGFSISDFSNSSYTLKYSFWSSGTAVTTVSCTAQNSYYRLTILPATTNGYTAGYYSYKAQIENSSGTVTERYTVRDGTFEIKSKPSTMVATDGRSHVKKIHDLIKTLLEGRVTKEADSITIGGRSLSRIPMADLVGLERKYAAMVKSEEKVEKIKKGIDPGSRILVRF